MIETMSNFSSIKKLISYGLLFCCGSAVAQVKETHLLNAIQKLDVNRVEKLLKQRPDINQLLADGSTALAWAVETQNPALVELLLQHGAKPDVPSPQANPFSPLFIACQYGNETIINALLDAGADVNHLTREAIAPLQPCSARSSVAVLQRMLSMGAEINHVDAFGQTALMWAAAEGNLPTINWLLAQGSDVNKVTKKGFTPLFFALKSKVPAAPFAIMKAGGDTNHIGPEQTTAVQMAMYQGQYGFAETLVKNGADMSAFDRNGYQLLHAAVLADQPQLVQLLIEKGAKINGESIISRVKWRYESNFKAGEHVVGPRSALMLAAENGLAEMMALLVRYGADTSVRTEDGDNIVLAAAVSGSVPALTYALQLQPDVNVVNNKGLTPLHKVLYTQTGDTLRSALRLLYEKGARVDIADRSGTSPEDIGADEQFKGRADFVAIFNS